MDDDAWSDVAQEWSEIWAAAAAPVWGVLLRAAAVGSGTRVLDVGCGSGELLGALRAAGAHAAGLDPAPGMLRLAARRAPGAVVLGSSDDLPFRGASFDVVTAVNALDLADDADEVLTEVTRVLVPGGRLALAGWAEGALNDFHAIATAVAAVAGEDPPDHGDLRREGGFERVLAGADLAVVASGLVDVPWEPADDDALVRGALLGEDDDGLRRVGPAVIAAAEPFRTPDGGYRLLNRFRWAVARTRA